MPFTQFKLDIATAQSRGIFNQYVYETDDTVADVTSPSYFLKSRFADQNPEIWIGGVINCKCSDGFVEGEIDSSGTITPISGSGVSLLTEGQVPKKDSTLETFVYSGATVDPITGEWTFDQSINVPAGSVNIGPNITLSDFGEILAQKNNATGINDLSITAEEIEVEGILLPEIPTSPPSETLAAQPIETDLGPEFTENTPFEFILNPAAFSSSVPSDEFLILENMAKLASIPDSGQLRNEIWIGTDDTGHKIFDFVFTLNLGDYNFRPPIPQVFRSGNLYFVRSTPVGTGIYQHFGLRVSPSSFFNKSEINGYPIQRNQAVTRKTAGHSSDTYLRLNDEYTTASGLTGGIVVNNEPTATADTVTAGQFTPGVAATSNPTVVTDGSATFAQNDIVLIKDTNFNNKYFEVESHISTLLTIRGIGTVAKVEDFTEDNFINGIDTAVITKVNVSIIRCGVDGVWETGQGATTPIVFSSLGSVAAGPLNAIQFNNPLGSFNGSSNFEFDNVSSRVTIGNPTVPQSRLHIYDNNTATTNNGLLIEQDGSGDAIAQFLITGIQRWVIGVDNNDSDKFKFTANADLGINTLVTIDTNGNMGINVNSPLSRLHVADGVSGLTPSSETVLTLESNVSAVLSLLCPNTFSSQIAFSANGNPADGTIVYNGATSGGFDFTVDDGLFVMNMTSTGQIGIGVPSSVPHPSAILDIGSTTRGVLLPRMTNAQILLIPSPADGLKAYSTGDHFEYQYDGSRSKWLSVDTTTYQFGSNGATDNNELNFNSTQNSTSGVLLPRNGTVVSVTGMQNSGNTTKGFEVRSEGISIFAYTLVASKFISNVVNADFLAVEAMHVFAIATGSAANNPTACVTVKWRL